MWHRKKRHDFWLGTRCSRWHASLVLTGRPWIPVTSKSDGGSAQSQNQNVTSVEFSILMVSNSYPIARFDAGER